MRLNLSLLQNLRPGNNEGLYNGGSCPSVDDLNVIKIGKKWKIDTEKEMRYNGVTF